MIFISSIPLNWDHYDPDIPSFQFLDSVSPKSLQFKKINNNNNNNNNNKIKILEYLYTFRSAVSFALTCLLVFRSAVSVAIWYLYSKAVFVAKLGYLYFSTVSLVVVDYLYFASSFVITHIHFYPQIKRK